MVNSDNVFAKLKQSSIIVLLLCAAASLSISQPVHAQISEFNITASDGAVDDIFGWSISISGDYAIVGALGDDDNGDNSGSAYLFKRTGTSWAQEAKLLPSDGAAEDRFGSSVSISGDYAVVGAFLDYGVDRDEFKLFTHISARDSRGEVDPKYFQSKNNGEISFKGDSTIHAGSDGYPVQSSYKDFKGEPQLKAQFDLIYIEDWRFWIRYTSSGQTIPQMTKRQFEDKDEWEDYKSWRAESFISAIEHKYKLSNVLSLKSILSFDSEFFYISNI